MKFKIVVFLYYTAKEKVFFLVTRELRKTVDVVVVDWTGLD